MRDTGVAACRAVCLDGIFLTAGAALYAVSVNAFTLPNHIAPGGVTGVSNVLHDVFGTPVGLLVFLLNIPIMLWGAAEIGYRLVFKTLAAVALSSALIDLFSRFVPAYRGDPIVAALCAGLCEGLGLSLTLLRGATTGGTDMVARVLGGRFPHLSMGRWMLCIDGVIIAVSAFIYGNMGSAVYACIVIFVSTRIIDAVLYGTDVGTGKLFFVMSPAVREIGGRVIRELRRSVTYLDSHGGYTDMPGETMLCAVRRYEVCHLQRIIREVDRDAFVIVGDAGEITGEGFRPAHTEERTLRDFLQRRAGRRG